MSGVLFGVCGIGHGHIHRQIPLIDHLASAHEIVLFAYNNSLRAFQHRYAAASNITVIEVAVPYYVGGEAGLDFNATALHPVNQQVDFALTNAQAMHQARKCIGRPKVIISDY